MNLLDDGRVCNEPSVCAIADVDKESEWWNAECFDRALGVSVEPTNDDNRADMMLGLAGASGHGWKWKFIQFHGYAAPNELDSFRSL